MTHLITKEQVYEAVLEEKMRHLRTMADLITYIYQDKEFQSVRLRDKVYEHWGLVCLYNTEV